NITPLSSLTSLQRLDLSHNQIIDINPLAGLTNLEELNLRNNQINNISPLINLTRIRILDLSNNWINDITPLVSNPGLGQGDIVYLQNNNLDIASNHSNLLNIQLLQSRGVKVYYE
ncbi:MAG TPA: leucine-rich repeat domain-containing protein, partial [bacterium]|nr:leucine-rich repeat domain-containing protein [bacterium]